MAGDKPKSAAAVNRTPPSSSKPPPSSSTPNSRHSNPSKPSPKPGSQSGPKPYPTQTQNQNHFHHQLEPAQQPPPPSYGFQMLDRRTIVLADGSVRSYFALPPDYLDMPPPRPRLLGLDHHQLKRKFDDDRDRDRDRERDWQKQQVLQYGGNSAHGPGPGSGPSSSSPFRPSKVGKFDGGGGIRVDPGVIKAFLKFVKVIYDNGDLRQKLLDNGKRGPVQCLACTGGILYDILYGNGDIVAPFVGIVLSGKSLNEKHLLCLLNVFGVPFITFIRSSKHFPDVHSLVMHAHKPDNADSQVDHLGLHRALCALMGWNCMRAPDNSRMYQFLPAEDAAAFQDDLIVWPPTVIIHNTNTGKAKDGRMEGLGNKAMDSKLREEGHKAAFIPTPPSARALEALGTIHPLLLTANILYLGFSGGKSKSLYNREGHLGITLIKFGGDQLGLKEAVRLSDHFEKDRHGRRDWTHVQSTGAGQNDENNPNFVMVDKRIGERTRILYGYLLTAADLDKVDPDTRKKAVIESKLEKLHASK
ncbi:hypothetical protein KSS87_008066 [Heliosperma pusillum]|nr:hypothetical protein KSS87_008066 [Heliosperma pusillum]